MNPDPKIDAESLAEEVKRFIDEKKMDLVDWNYWNVECYPHPEDDSYPGLKAFAAMWDNLFSYADELMRDSDDESKFPNDIVKRYEAETKRIEQAVNDDEKFWSDLREEILPLYQPPSARSDVDVSPVWREIREYVLSGEDVGAAPNDAADMQYLLTNWESLNNKATRALKKELGDESMDSAQAKVAYMNWFDKMILSRWQNRWQKIEMYYYPESLPVTVTEIHTNPKTGERKRGKVISETNYPPGFVVKIL